MEDRKMAMKKVIWIEACDHYGFPYGRPIKNAHEARKLRDQGKIVAAWYERVLRCTCGCDGEHPDKELESRPIFGRDKSIAELGI
jgi:hypothetical protein